MNEYSDFAGIKDAKFHELRLAYIKAEKELKAYIGLDAYCKGE